MDAFSTLLRKLCGPEGFPASLLRRCKNSCRRLGEAYKKYRSLRSLYDRREAEAKVDEIFKSIDLDVSLRKHFYGGFDNQRDYEKYGDLWQPLERALDEEKEKWDRWWADLEALEEVAEEGSGQRDPTHGGSQRD